MIRLVVYFFIFQHPALVEPILLIIPSLTNLFKLYLTLSDVILSLSANSFLVILGFSFILLYKLIIFMFLFQAEVSHNRRFHERKQH